MRTCVAFNSDLVSQLPTPKPRKTRPELYFVSLIVQDEAKDSLLLELQDKKGIWHGLWAPPSAPCSSQPTEAELKALVGHWFRQYELPIDAWGALMQQVLVFNHQPWLVHELTHRKMHFKVLLLKWPAPRVRLFAPTDKPVPKIVDKLIAHAAQSTPLTQGAVAQ